MAVYGIWYMSLLRQIGSQYLGLLEGNLFLYLHKRTELSTGVFLINISVSYNQHM